MIRHKLTHLVIALLLFSLLPIVLALVPAPNRVAVAPNGLTAASDPTMTTQGSPGYWLVAADGGVFTFGGAGFYGSAGALPLVKPVVGLAGTLDGGGYWLAGSDGGVFSFGDAQFHGSAGGLRLTKPVIGIAATQKGGGYWLVSADGGVFAFGNAGFYGSLGSVRLNSPIVGIASSADGKGYWLVAADGGVFAFGDAGFYGSLGGRALAQPVVSLARTGDGRGYWLVGADGGVFAFGDAAFLGSPSGDHLGAPVVDVSAPQAGKGYWLVGADGGVFSYGAARFYGSAGNLSLRKPIVGAAAPPPVIPIAGPPGGSRPGVRSVPTSWQVGSTIQPSSPTSFASATTYRAIEELAASGATTVTFVIQLFQTSVDANSVSAGSTTPTDAAIGQAVAEAEHLGLHVMLKVHDDLPSYGVWRANFLPSDPGAWFSSYENELDHYAQLGQSLGVYELCLGTEMLDLTTPRFTQNWIDLIKQVRAEFTGRLTYDDDHSSFGSASSVQFWSYLDDIGVSAYFSLAIAPGTADSAESYLPQLLNDWASLDASTIGPVARRYNKPILFTEIGYESSEGTNVCPSASNGTDCQGNAGVPDNALQAAEYQAFFLYWTTRPFAAGVEFWYWQDAPGEVDPQYSSNFPIQGKPAGQVFASWLGGSAPPLVDDFGPAAGLDH